MLSLKILDLFRFQVLELFFGQFGDASFCFGAICVKLRKRDHRAGFCLSAGLLVDLLDQILVRLVYVVCQIGRDADHSVVIDMHVQQVLESQVAGCIGAMSIGELEALNRFFRLLVRIDKLL